MNRNETLPNQEVERMLSAFFKSELPKSFPPLRLPAASELPMPIAAESVRTRRGRMLKAKLSLAVSVALLIGGSWYLSGHTTNSPGRTKIGTGTVQDSAKVPDPLKNATKQ